MQARCPPGLATRRRAGCAAARPRATGGGDSWPGRPTPAVARSRTLREPAEVRLALLHVRVPPLLGLLAHVEEEIGVVRELLDAGEAVLGGVEAGLQDPQRERRELEHLAAPADGLLLELL